MYMITKKRSIKLNMTEFDTEFADEHAAGSQVCSACVLSLMCSALVLSFTVSCHLLRPWLVSSSSSILPFVALSLSTSPLSYLSYTHLSILGLASLFFFSLVCAHLAFFSLDVLLFRSPHMAVPHQCRFSIIFLDG